MFAMGVRDFNPPIIYTIQFKKVASMDKGNGYLIDVRKEASPRFQSDDVCGVLVNRQGPANEWYLHVQVKLISELYTGIILYMGMVTHVLKCSR